MADVAKVTASIKHIQDRFGEASKSKTDRPVTMLEAEALTDK